jgi:hypothetical protein
MSNPQGGEEAEALIREKAEKSEPCSPDRPHPGGESKLGDEGGNEYGGQKNCRRGADLLNKLDYDFIKFRHEYLREGAFLISAFFPVGKYPWLPFSLPLCRQEYF